MSFLGFFKKVGTGIEKVGKIVANPTLDNLLAVGVGFINPALGALINKYAPVAQHVESSIAQVEVAHIQAGLSGTGADKKAEVVAGFNAILDAYGAIFGKDHTDIQLSAEGQKRLSDGIDASVLAKNNFGLVQAEVVALLKA